MRKAMMISTMLLTALELCGCAGIPLPIGKESHINAKSGYRLEYNFQTDFDSNLNKVSGAKGVRVPTQFSDLQGWICFAPASYENAKAYGLKIRNEYESGQCSK